MSTETETPKTEDPAISIALLHSETRRTGDDVRSLGSKLESFKDEVRSTLTTIMTTQSANYGQHEAKLAVLATVDSHQQDQINELKAASDKKSTNRLSVWAIIIAGLAAVGAFLQSAVTYFHK